MKIKTIIAAFLAVSVVAATGAIMTGCGGNSNKTDATAATTVAATTAAATTAKAQTSESSQTQAETGSQSDKASESNNGIGISRDEAVANVKKQAGTAAQVISVEEGADPDGLPCYVVEVSVVTTDEEAKTVTYYSGYQFCYADNYRDADNGDSSGNIGITEEEAVANVKKQAGTGAEIISVEEGVNPDGLPCYIVVVSPITKTEEATTVTYYSGYLFCYAAQ